MHKLVVQFAVTLLTWAVVVSSSNGGKPESDSEAEACYKRAEELIKQGKDAAAIAQASQAIKLKPDYSSAYAVRGIAYARIKEFDKAIADLTEVIRLDPKNPDNYKNRAVVYGLKGDKEKALADQDTVNRLLAK